MDAVLHEQGALQATQQVLDLFEKSKAQSEEALEAVPGVYAVIDEKGRILKGNKYLAKVFGIDHEDLLNRNLSRIFSKKDWAQFNEHIANLKKQVFAQVEFQTDLIGDDTTNQNFWWYMSPLTLKREDAPHLYTILGRDVTELTRATENSTRMKIELDTAKMMQETLFPPPLVKKFGDSSIAGYYESASECGGDWWNYCIIGEKLFLWIGDVTGHGMAAALVTAAVHAAVAVIEDGPITPLQALTVLDRAVSATGKGHRLMTFFIASIDLKTGECVYTSASHEPGYLLPFDKTELTVRDFKPLLAAATQPLGSPRNVEYREYRTVLKPGDRIFLYTDGIYDIRGPEGKSWSCSSFRRALATAASTHRGTEDLVEGMRKVITEIRENTPLCDDVTYLVFQF